MAHYFIGDVQGCYEPLQRLLEAIEFDPAADQLIFCGDVVNRGGRSQDVLRLLYSIRGQVIVTLGNHDFHLLAEDMRQPEGRSRNREFRQILTGHDRRELIDWLSHQPLVYRMESENILALHAGVVPQWSLEDTVSYAAAVEKNLRSEKRNKLLKRMFRDRRRIWRDDLTGMKRKAMTANILTRIRYCNRKGKINYAAAGPPGTQPEGYKPWFKHKNRLTRDVKIVFGHWAALGLRVKKRYVALDSGCVWGRCLTAWRAEDGEIFQVPYKT